MSYIKQSFIENLLDAAHIDVVIGKYVELKRAGANLKGFSPFSKENTPSFTVSPVKNIWKDFSTGKGGNLVSFVMEKESCTYPEAIKIIAGHMNMTVEYEELQLSEQQKERLEKKEQLRKTLESVWILYQEQFKKLPEDHPAKIEVFQNREYNDEKVLDWGIGFAPENFLYDKLERSGKLEDGKALGLVNKSELGNKYDKYTNRVIYPIHDVNGLLIGLAGRDITGSKKTGKWINPTVDNKNILYNKSKVLYGLHKAKAFIRKRQEVFIVEGYNDVIGFHECGLENTVAPCGTAITDQQINLLKKFTSKVVLCMDPDKAGKASVLKYIPEFIKSGMRVEVIELDLDPDDFTRKYHDLIGLSEGLDNMFKPNELRQDGFKLLMNEKLQGSEIEISVATKELCDLIGTIKDEFLSESVYIPWLTKKSKISITSIKKWVKESKINEIEIITDDFDDYEYELPKDVEIPFKELEQDIKLYGLFMANSKIYFSVEKPLEGKVHFVPLSNFEIEVLQHMADDKFPSLLIRMKNVMKNEAIFDCPTETFNSLIRFKDVLSKHHNFIFKGKNNHLEKLQIYLFNKMGKGVKIDVLGQQLDRDFFVLNNGIVIDGEEREIDENGRIIIENTHYYIASANKIYKNNPYKYNSEKSFRIIKSKISFYELLTQAAKVHRHHYISPVLYGITCLFRDIVVDANNNFPILFLYGQGGTGKDELGRLVMSLTGIPQKPISLEAELSTQKATIRVLAQFRNGIIMFSEYKRGNQKQDGSLKGIYDLLGYSIGTLDSKFSTDYIPVEAGLILTGNEFPESEPLIQRTIWNQMDKNIFTQKEKDEMEILKEMISKGVSGHAVEFLKHRNVVKTRFSDEYVKWQAILTKIFPNTQVRIVNNLSVISAFYGIFSDIIKFPFTQFEMMDHFKIGVEQQMFRIQSTSLLVKFWDSFIGAFKTSIDNRITAKKIVNIEGNSLFIQWTHVYTKVQIQWFAVLKEAAPKKEVVLEEIKKIPNCFIAYHDVYSFDSGRKAVRSSAVELNLMSLDIEIRNNIIGAFMEQIYSESLFGTEEMDKLDALYEAPKTNVTKILKQSNK